MGGSRVGRRGGVWDALSGFGSRVSVEWEGAGVRLRGVGINRPVHIQSTVHTDPLWGQRFPLGVFLAASPPDSRKRARSVFPRGRAAYHTTCHTIERMIERLPRVFPSSSGALGSVLAVGRSGENPENPSSTYSIFLVNQNSSINSKNIAYEACVQRWSHGKNCFSFLQLTM